MLTGAVILHILIFLKPNHAIPITHYFVGISSQVEAFLSIYLFLQMEYIDIGTPVSNKHYLGNPEGELFGLKNIKYRFQPECCMYLRPETGIPGLYITGYI